MAIQEQVTLRFWKNIPAGVVASVGKAILATGLLIRSLEIGVRWLRHGRAKVGRMSYEVVLEDKKRQMNSLTQKRVQDSAWAEGATQ